MPNKTFFSFVHTMKYLQHTVFKPLISQEKYILVINLKSTDYVMTWNSIFLQIDYYVRMMIHLSSVSNKETYHRVLLYNVFHRLITDWKKYKYFCTRWKITSHFCYSLELSISPPWTSNIPNNLRTYKLTVYCTIF